MFSETFDDVIKLLVELALNTSNKPQNNDFTKNGTAGFATIYSLISNIPLDKQDRLNDLLQTFYEMIENSMKAEDPLYSRREELQGYLFM